MTKQSVVIYPSDVEREAEKLYDELIDLGRRDPKGALTAAKQAHYAIRTFIEERNPKPMAPNSVKVIQGNRVYTRERTALSEIEALAEQRASKTGRTVAQCYAEVLSDRPELYDRYNEELASCVYAQPIAAAEPAPQGKTLVSDLMLATAEGYVRDGDEKNIADALSRVARESPALYAAYVNESRSR